MMQLVDALTAVTYLPCRSKAQELRVSLSSNSLGFLTPGRANGLIAFGAERAAPIVRRGFFCR